MPQHTAPPASAIADMLADRMEALVRTLLPTAQIRHDVAIVGSPAGETGESCKIYVSGDRQGRWRDFASDSGGDALDLIEAVLHLQTSEAISWATKWLGLGSESNSTRRAFGRASTTAKPIKPDGPYDAMVGARHIWNSSAPLSEGDPAAMYLRSRGLCAPWPPSLRYSPALTHTESKQKFPALIAEVRTGGRGLFIGIQRIFLTQAGDRAPVKNPKKSLGKLAGGAVRLGPRSDRLILTEGVETGLAVQRITGCQSVWACLGTAGLRVLELPKDVNAITIAADNDAAGLEAAHAAARRFKASGCTVKIFIPKHGANDFNDVIKGAGL
jgi:hypothetical protein